MAHIKKRYQRLPGRDFALLSTQQLWQASDHLLWVESAMFQVRYKRFYYQDIQALVLHRSNRHQVWSFVWGAFALLFGIIALSVSGTPYVSATWAMVFLICLVVNLSMGPACQVQLQTAVQVQQLKCLRRIRSATKAMNRIHALVEDAQGLLNNNKPDPGSSPAMPIAPLAMPLVGAHQPEAPDGPFKPLVHKVLFGLMLVIGILGAIQMGMQNVSVGVIQLWLQIAVQIMVMTALVRYHRQTRGTQVGLISWLSLVLAVFNTTVSYGIFMVAVIRHQEIAYDYWALFKKCFELVYWDHPVALAIRIVWVAVTLILAIWGLQALGRSAAAPSNGSSQGAQDITP
jgi:hypothetical protein